MPSAGGSTAAYAGAGTTSTGVAAPGCSSGICSLIMIALTPVSRGSDEGLSTRLHRLAHRVHEVAGRQAAAQVAGERLADRGLARLRLTRQQVAHAQADAGQAVATAGPAVRGERGGHRV